MKNIGIEVEVKNEVEIKTNENPSSDSPKTSSVSQKIYLNSLKKRQIKKKIKNQKI